MKLLVKGNASEAVKAAMSYEAWIERVDTMLHRRYGIGVNDGADWPSRDSYDRGDTPHQGMLVWIRYQEGV